MKRWVEIKKYLVGTNATLYTIHLDGNKKSELDDFVDRFKEHKSLSRDYNFIAATLKTIMARGAEDRYFRPEKKFQAIPWKSAPCDLRLICFRFSTQILILGNGGEKTSKKVQDSPDIYPHFLIMEQIEKYLRTHRKDPDVYDNKGMLKKNLAFEIETTE